jgi:putative hemolysin
VTTEEEYRELLDLAFQQGALAQQEKEIIAEIIGLDQKTAAGVMTPRSKMACISDDLSVEEMLAQARRLRHRHLPLYDESPDTIVGVLDTKLLLLNPEIDLAEAIDFPSFVPESMNLLKLFIALQRQQRGVALVVDEFGGTAGVVTMEDILEEVVGEIRSEGELPGFIMEKLAEGRWRVSGAMNVADFRREYPELGAVDVETMGGLLGHLLEVVPAPGESTTFRGLKLTAHAAEERVVRELLIERLARK